MITQSLKKLALVGIGCALLTGNQTQAMAPLARTGAKAVRTGIGLTMGGTGALFFYNRLKRAPQVIQTAPIPAAPIITKVPKNLASYLPSIKTTLVVGAGLGTAYLTWRTYQWLFGDKFNEINKNIAAVDEKVTAVGQQVTAVDQKVSEAQAALAQLDVRQQELLREQQALTEQVQNNHIENQQAHAAARAQLEQLNNNLELVHQEMAKINTALTQLKEGQDALSMRTEQYHQEDVHAQKQLNLQLEMVTINLTKLTEQQNALVRDQHSLGQQITRLSDDQTKHQAELTTKFEKTAEAQAEYAHQMMQTQEQILAAVRGQEPPQDTAALLRRTLPAQAQTHGQTEVISH